jgi:alkyl hydroperoxide reductase subunit D
MEALEIVRQKFPDIAKDIKLNLQSVLGESSLSVEQKWGAAVACAIAVGNVELRDATIADARKQAPAGVVEDAAAAAVLMAMNNVFYRSRHMLGKESYNSKSPRLRMNRMLQPASGKANFELFSLAVSAIHGCEVCLQAHEKTLIEHHGVSEDQIVETLRIAAVFHAAGAALGTGL